MKSGLAFLDLTTMDRSVIAYGKALIDKAGLQHITFIHYIEFQDVSDDYSEYFPDLDKPLSQVIEEEIREKIEAKNLPAKSWSLEIVEKGGQQKLMDWINNSEFDLCIFGKKKKAQGTGVFAGKVARLIHKSVLFVTENEAPTISHLMAPVDFSRYSKQVVKVADQLSSTLNTSLTVLHVYRTPPSYFPFMEKANDKLLKEVKDKADRELNKFCDNLCSGDNIRASLLHAEGKPVATQMYEYAQQHEVDMILLGIKGQTDDEGLLIGSVAERLIRADQQIPVLLVKA